MILLTGAAGKTGQAIIKALQKTDAPVRALVHRQSHVARVQSLGAAETVVGDMTDPATLRRAMRGATAVYHICPNVSPHELSIGQAVIEAARATGVAHIVYHSVLHPHIQAMPHHWQKLRVEEKLFESGLPFTILQPAAYMQNILPYWDDMRTLGVYRVPYAATAHLSAVHLDDVAEVAARVLTGGNRHHGAIYELCGAENLSPEAIAAAASKRLGRPVRVEVIPLPEWRANAEKAGLGRYQIDTLAAMFAYYGQFGFWGSPVVLGSLLDRPPTSFAAFLAGLEA